VRPDSPGRRAWTGLAAAGFVEHGAKVWTAGYEKDLATGRARNYGSGSGSGKPALTKGQLAAKLVWDGNGLRVCSTRKTWSDGGFEGGRGGMSQERIPPTAYSL
jgi:hypothetical protein